MPRINVAQIFLPGEFEPPPAECNVSTDGKHHWTKPQRYSNILYFPDSTYTEYCSFCGSKKGVT